MRPPVLPIPIDESNGTLGAGNRNDELAGRVMRAAGAVPNPEKYRAYLKTLTEAALSERLFLLETEALRPLSGVDGKKQLSRILNAANRRNKNEHEQTNEDTKNHPVATLPAFVNAP